jgi:hypothetical protein
VKIIEIGACWATEGGVVLERFQHLVRPHQNAKRLFAKAQRIGKEVGMVRACALTGMSMEGPH